RPHLVDPRQAIRFAGKDEHRYIARNATRSRKRRNSVEMRNKHRRDRAQTCVGDVAQYRRQGVVRAIPHCDFQVLLWAFKNVSANAMAELTGGEKRSSSPHRYAAHDDRTAWTSLLEIIDCRPDILPRSPADIVVVSGRIAMCPKRD